MLLAGSLVRAVGLVFMRGRGAMDPRVMQLVRGPVRLALAAGKPLVANKDAMTDAIVGPAAYLVSPGDQRALGAALVTVVVEEQVAMDLSRAAVQHSASWSAMEYREQLAEIYAQVLKG